MPLVIGIAALRGLTHALPIFHSDDEFNYHYPTILRFSHELPFPDLVHYKAAQTPLFHLLMAYVGKVIGYELWRLRLVEVLISYALALAVFVLLRRRLGLPQLTALALTLLFTLSPYVLGSSFRVITDNLATLFIVLALERFERFRATRSLAVFAVGSACVGAAILTRQSAAFMLGVGGCYTLFLRDLPLRDRVLGLGTLAATAVPAGVLFLEWHGLVPPGGDPSSCGLCGGVTGLTVGTPELALATIGLYGAVLWAPALVAAAPGLVAGPDGERKQPREPVRGPLRELVHRPLRELVRGPLREIVRGPLREPLLGVLLGALLLLAFPSRPSGDAAGVIASAARHFPAVLGSSLLYWALVPACGAVLAWRLRAAPEPWPVAVFLACFLVGALVIRYPWQKYVDPFALLVLIATVRPTELRSRRALAGAAVLAVAFVAYTLASHPDIARPPTTPPAAAAAPSPLSP